MPIRHKIILGILVLFFVNKLPAQTIKSIDDAIKEGYTKTLLKSGTEVQMVFQSTIAVDQFDVGNYVFLRVYQPVVSEDAIIVIPIGSEATGRIAKIKKPGIFGREAYIEIEPVSVRTKGNQSIDLLAKDDVNFVRRGKNKTPISIGISAGAGLAGGTLLAMGNDEKGFEPAGLSFGLIGFFYKGGDQAINQGEVVIAEIKSDTPIKFIE